MILTKEEYAQTLCMLPQKRAETLAEYVADLERQRDTAQGQLVENAGAYAEALKTLAGSQERAVLEAHAAAIQAAANIEFDEPTGCSTSVWSGLSLAGRNAILSLTPVTAQHLYDLRIKEAVRGEIIWWLHRDSTTLVHDDLNCTCEEHLRLASASAEVERLKGNTIEG